MIDPTTIRLSRIRQERWLPVVGYEGLYEVSSLGRVRSWFSNQGRRRIPKYLKLVPSKRHGYYQVSLYSVNGYCKTPRLHKLVLAAFVGPCPQGLERRHKDGDKSNNALHNLAYATKQENTEDRHRHGTVARGSRHGCAKLNEETVRVIKRQLASMTQLEVALAHNITKERVCAIANGQSWKHV